MRLSLTAAPRIVYSENFYDFSITSKTIVASELGGAAPEETYTASGVDDTNAVGVGIHRSFGNGVMLSGTAISSTLGSATAITANETSLTHTFTYNGEEEIGLFLFLRS